MTETAHTWWWVALAIGAVVLVVVAVLLELIVRTARDIKGLVSDIWTGGKMIAANTATIDLLARTNDLAGELLSSAGRIHASTERIREATGGKT